MTEQSLLKDSDNFEQVVPQVTAHIIDRHNTSSSLPTIPTQASISQSISQLPAALPSRRLGTRQTTQYIRDSLLPGCLQAQNGPRYFGFVVGGTTPAAQIADILAGSYDENVQLTLPPATASTAVEARTLEMVLDLLDIPRDVYAGRTITTGATASNILGLVCTRDHLYAQSRFLPQGYSYAQDGPPCAPGLPTPSIIVLALHPHFSITKAAGLVGIGGGSRVVHAMPAAEDDELAFDLEALRARLEEEKTIGRGVIVAYGLGEVNTGGFGRDLNKVAEMCRETGAWLHVDAAFGGFAAVLPELKHLTKGMDMADSLTLDGHKWLNVPYDCGLFYTRHTSSLTNVFAPPASGAPAYLSNGSSEIIRRNIDFARRVATYIDDSPHYHLLNPTPLSYESSTGKKPIIPLNIVLFRGSDTSEYSHSEPDSSTRLTAAINATRKVYVTGTKWRGEGAVRLAVSNWRTGLEEDDYEIVKQVLDDIAGVTR